jgi:SpoVK/Ycf46/Vps4 family AAA+-type ATPase
MEKLQGVLIATTNLNTNFDRAFERRFLFKVQFNQPNKMALGQIWKSKMPSLKPSEIELLTQKFHLTGAQVDNIVRKALIDQHAMGRKVVLDDLIGYCEKEIGYGPNRNVLGFRT